mmetsp:Transcript_3273/g.6993  ORF Transcript_3273/g.6993 Transcript_3273/m.6993 type:complete len:309 (-) Transcript_3273:1569-2495(-)
MPQAFSSTWRSPRHTCWNLASLGSGPVSTLHGGTPVSKMNSMMPQAHTSNLNGSNASEASVADKISGARYSSLPHLHGHDALLAIFTARPRSVRGTFTTMPQSIITQPPCVSVIKFSKLMSWCAKPNECATSKPPKICASISAAPCSGNAPPLSSTTSNTSWLRQGMTKKMWSRSSTQSTMGNTRAGSPRITSGPASHPDMRRVKKLKQRTSFSGFSFMGPPRCCMRSTEALLMHLIATRSLDILRTTEAAAASPPPPASPQPPPPPPPPEPPEPPVDEDEEEDRRCSKLAASFHKSTQEGQRRSPAW